MCSAAYNNIGRSLTHWNDVEHELQVLEIFWLRIFWTAAEAAVRHSLWGTISLLWRKTLQRDYSAESTSETNLVMWSNLELPHADYFNWTFRVCCFILSWCKHLTWALATLFVWLDTCACLLWPILLYTEQSAMPCNASMGRIMLTEIIQGADWHEVKLQSCHTQIASTHQYNFRFCAYIARELD